MGRLVSFAFVRTLMVLAVLLWGTQGNLVFYMSFDDDTYTVDSNLCPVPQDIISPATAGANTAIVGTNRVAPALGNYVSITSPGAANPIHVATSSDLGTALFKGKFDQISFAAWFYLDLTGVTLTARDFTIFGTDSGSGNDPKVVISLQEFNGYTLVPQFSLPYSASESITKPLALPLCPDLPPFNSSIPACPNITTNVWHHLAFSFDGGSLHMFLDGEEQGLPVAFPTPTYFPWTTSDLYIGGDGITGNTGRRFFGALDDLRIYDHALQPSEVAALFARPPSLVRPTLTTVDMEPSPVVLEKVSQLLNLTVQGSDPNDAALQYYWEDITSSGCQLLSFLAPNSPNPGITLTGIGVIQVAAGVSNLDLCVSDYYNYSVIGSAATLQVQPVNGSVFLYEYTDTSVVVTGFPTPSFQWEILVIRSVVRPNDSSIITQELYLPIPGQIGSTLRLLNANDSFAGLPSRRSDTPIFVRVAFQNKFSSSVGHSDTVAIYPLSETRPANSSSGDGDGTIAAIVVPVVVGPILLCLCCLLLLLLLLMIVAIRRRRGGGEWKPDLTEPDYNALAYGRFLDTPPSVSKKQLAALKKLEELLMDSDYLLTRLLCDNAKATEADNVAKVITYLYAAHGEAVGLVEYFITKEVEASNKEGTLFRANSISSKMFTTYSRVIALEYVWTIFAYPVAELDHMAEVASGEAGSNSLSHNTIMGPMAMEVDPSKMDEAADDQINTLELWLVAQKLFTGMTKAKSAVPSDVRRLLRHVQTEVAGKFSEEAAHKAMGGFLFLRLLCPSLMAPQVYGLLKAPPNTMAQRQLILLAKVLQNLANDTLPGKKEGYMQRLNEFITSNQDRLRSFYADLIAHAEDGPHRRPSVPDSVKTNSLIQLHRYISVNYDKLSAVVQQEDEGLAEELQEVMDSIGNIDSDEL